MLNCSARVATPPWILRRLSPACLLLATLAGAQGTRQWTTARFEEFERGTPQNIAIRNDGRIAPAPALRTIGSASATYLWSLLPERNGTILAGTGAISGGSQLLRFDGRSADSNGKSADSKGTVLADFHELNVQALATAQDGSILAATSPDGKLYRIAPGGKPAVIFDTAATAEKPKYLWSLAVEKSGGVLVAAGAPAVIYRVSSEPGSKPQVLFRSGDQHIRTLLLSPDGTIYAGSDGAGIIYRITPDGKAFALFAAPKHEITALALDPAGNLYATAVGDRRAPTLPQLPAQGEPRIPITFTQPNSSVLSPTNALVPDGSEVYRIAPDGTPLRLLTLREEIAYALSFHHGALIIATGNRGHLYRVDPSHPGVSTDIAHVEANQAVALAPIPSGLAIATANSGKLLTLGDLPAPDATYTSEIFDGEIATLWGRVERTGSAGGITLFARSGNVENVRGALGDLWSPWMPVAPDQTPLPVPVARYLQWKAVLQPGAQLDAVTVNYLPRNLPPLVEDLVVVPGARIATAPPATPGPVVPVAFRAPAAAAPSPAAPEATPAPLLAQRDRTAVTARWIARDPNNDDLLFALYVRGTRERNWHLLKEKLTERVWSFDSALLPDGEYELRVVASDAPVHGPGEALESERISAPFTIDTTPPVPGPLSATVSGGRLTATFDAHDATSAIARAEFSIDAGPWQYVEPIGKLSDAQNERYRIDAPVSGTGEHTLALRVFDRFENTVSVKAVAQ